MKKVILIAGGSRGIGKFLADSLKDEFSISVCGRALEWTESDNFLSYKCDLRTREDTRGFVNITLNKFGHIDAVIYNAGLMLYDDLLYVEEEDIDAMYEVMVKGYLFLCQEILPIMRKQQHGHVINISSTRGITVAPNKSAYSAVKRAATSLTDSVRIENEQYGIKATSVHFGVVDTDSSREKYGNEIHKLNPVALSSVLETIRFLLSLAKDAQVDSIIVGGKL